MTTRNRTILQAAILLPFTAVLSGCCCEKEYYTTSYVPEYTISTGMRLRTRADNSLTITGIYGDSPRRVSFLSKGEDRVLYDNICEEHGDLSYNRTIYVGTATGWTFMVSSSYPDIMSVNVVADRDFDGEHPAGVSLNDCLSVTTICAYRYIQSGYDDTACPVHVTSLLSEVSREDLTVSLENYGVLRFVKEPEDTSGVYYLTVTFEMSDGQTFRTVKKYDFNKEYGIIPGDEA